MISSKVGTQGWSKAVQNHDFGDQALHLEAATPSSKGGDGVKDIGEKLNQIANPGGKEVSQKVRRAHNTLDKDDFLKLMLTPSVFLLLPAKWTGSFGGPLLFRPFSLLSFLPLCCISSFSTAMAKAKKPITLTAKPRPSTEWVTFSIF